MKKNYVLKKITICFAIIITLCFAKNTVASAAEEVGTVINVNEKITGALVDEDDVHWYTFRVVERSISSFEFGVNNVTDVEDANMGWDLVLYDENQTEIRTFSDVITVTQTPEIGLDVGTYYVKIKSTASSKGSSPNGCVYSLTVNNEITDEWEIENNDEKAKATYIEVDKNYHGALHHKKDEDWFKVDVTKSGYIKLAIELEEIEDIDKVEHGWEITLFDSENKEFNTYSYKENSETPIIPVGTGVYYVKISAEATSLAPIDCKYVFTVKNLNSSKWESEWNDTSKSADKISFNKTYKGNLHVSKDEDYFKVSVNAAGKMKVKLAPNEDVDIDAVNSGWKVYVYKGNDTTPVIKLNDITSVKSQTINVTKGVYYIRVKTDTSGSANAPLECTYNLTVNYSKKPSKVTGLSLASGTKKATVKWKEVSNATGYQVWRKLGSSGEWKKVKTFSDGATTKFTNKSLKSGKTYYYKVRAYRKTNGVTAYGNYSTVKKIKVK